jgi:hypothetical protein
VPTKVGAVRSLGRTGSKFIELHLDTGETVEVPHALYPQVVAYPSGTRLVFVERRGRFFRFVQWVGSVPEAVEAVDLGILAPHEVPPSVRCLVDAGTGNATASGDEPPGDHRLLFGPNGAQVAWLLGALGRSDPLVWEALTAAQAEIAGRGQAEWWRRLDLAAEDAVRRGVRSGALSLDDLSISKDAAERASQAALPVVVDRLMQRTSEPRERVSAIFGDLATGAATVTVTLLIVRPFLGEDVFRELWGPYARVFRL